MTTLQPNQCPETGELIFQRSVSTPSEHARGEGPAMPVDCWPPFPDRPGLISVSAFAGVKCECTSCKEREAIQSEGSLVAA